MTDYAYQVYESIIQATSSELILFFVILSVFLAVTSVPLYAFIMNKINAKIKHESEKHDKYIEREREIIAVVRENSAAIAANTATNASLKYFLETTSADTKLALGRIHERIDLVLLDTAQIKTAITIKGFEKTVERNMDDEK